MMQVDIKALLLQRAPVLMVDALVSVEGDEAHTCFTIRPGNFFLDEEGRLEDVGLIEHIAQSASAFAGYMAKLAGAVDPPMGYIGEVKRFRCHRLPRTGDELLTCIRMGAEAAGVRLLWGETRAGGETVAETQMKIFISPGK